MMMRLGRAHPARALFVASFRQWYQGPVSDVRGPKRSPCTIPKFPEEPKFGMVPPSTPDRLLVNGASDCPATATRLFV